MALTKDEREALDEIQKRTTEVSTVLLGVDGSPGLVDEVKELAKGYGKLKRNFWLLVGILAGSGVIGGGLSLLSGG